MILFIDAMDECDDDEVRDLVGYFSRLIKKAYQLGAELNVCLPSRHYPQISIDGCPEIVVEDHNNQDILRYIEAEAEDSSLINSVKENIVEKSRGVLPLGGLGHLLSKEVWSRRGKSLKWLEKKLDEIPFELETLFSQLMSEVDEEELLKTFNLIYIMIFAHEGLGPRTTFTPL